MLHNDLDPASLILQRLQAQEAWRESQRNQVRLRFAANVRALWSERNFLVSLSMLGLLLGVLVAFLIPVRYTSTVRLMPPDNQSNSSLAMATASMPASPGADLAAGIAGDLLSLKNSSDAFAAILRSRTAADQIIQQFDLKQVYGVARMRDARNLLASRVSVSVDRKDETITMTVTDRSPERARDIANAYVDQLNRLASDLGTSSARRERIFLEGRLAQVNQELQDAEKMFSQFSSKNSAIDLKEQAKVMLGAAATLQGQLMSAQSDLEGLRQIYTDSNVRIRSLKARIAELQSQLARLGGKDRSPSFSPDTDAADLYPPIRKLPLLGATYADLYRRTKVQEAVYQVLTQEYELAKVEEAREIPTVKVLDPPDLPEVKSFPPRSAIATCATLSALIGGVVFLLASKSWKDKNPHDLGKALATEIWIDLKEKRFLNSARAVSDESAADSPSSLRKRSLSWLLGLNDEIGYRNGSSRATYGPEENSRAD